MARPPLDGLRILAVSQFGAGPFGTPTLDDMGAGIVKVGFILEPPSRS